MGSRKSGWRRGSRETVDKFAHIDMYELRRQGAFEVGLELKYSVIDASDRLIIKTFPRSNYMLLSVSDKPDNQMKVMLEDVKAGSPAGAGHRTLALCPRCGDRKAHLYFFFGKHSVVVGCRQCFDLTYKSSQFSKNWVFYYTYKMFRIESKLGIPHIPHDGFYDGVSKYYFRAMDLNVPSKMTYLKFGGLWQELLESYKNRCLAISGQEAHQAKAAE